MKPIYLDCNASTPIAPEVVAALRPFLSRHYGAEHATRPGMVPPARQSLESQRVMRKKALSFLTGLLHGAISTQHFIP
jgi:cysteine sulfinate desulfinase/cysteine desulfurase-like protein